MFAIQWIPLGLGLLMASIDAFILSGLKAQHVGHLRIPYFMLIPTIVYALQPWIFSFSLNYSSLIIMNLLWDLLSGVIVTTVGLYWFGETLSIPKKIGVILSFVSIILLTCY